MRARGTRRRLDTEEQFLQAVRRVAQLYRWHSYHTRRSQGSDPGWPDLVLVRPPELMVAELKVGQRQPTPAQWEWLQVLAQCGAECYVWWPQDWPHIVQRLQRRHVP